MKVSHKVALVASSIIILVFTLYSWLQYHSVRDTLLERTAQNTQESAQALGDQITNWLNARLSLIDMMAQTIDADFNSKSIQKTFNTPILKDKFILIFGGLHTDGEKITNDPSWNPVGWDARKRPWYSYAQNNSRAVLTDPYPDAASGEILISAVAKLTDKGQFKGAFGGDLSLKTVSDALNTLNFNNTGYVYLMNTNGNIISHPDSKLNGKNISELYSQKPVLNNELQQVDINGQKALTSFHKLEGIFGSDWQIGIVLDYKKVMADANDMGITAAIATIISAIVCSLALYFTVSRQLQPLSDLRASLVEINQGEGDLTKRLKITRTDEFGQVSSDFNQFIGYLQNLIGQVKQVTNDVHHNSQQTASSASDSVQHLEKQLYELDQLATAMQEMSATAHDVALNAQTTANAVKEADNASSEGVDVVAKASEEIAHLSDDMESVVGTINELIQYSNNIESILTVITDIAEQTNLLALNAAIEAARAGESGRGFAVVADEVRALASRTQESTDEIRSTINQLQNGVKKAENTIAKSRQKARDTQETAEMAAQSLGCIRNSIGNISEMAIQIATAAEQQSATAEEINRNTTNIRDISQSVAEGSRGVEEKCQLMTQLSTQQSNELSKFSV